MEEAVEVAVRALVAPLQEGVEAEAQAGGSLKIPAVLGKKIRHNKQDRMYRGKKGSHCLSCGKIWSTALEIASNYKV